MRTVQLNELRKKFFLVAGFQTLAICIALFFGVSYLPFNVRADARTIGHVLDVEGDWFLDGRRDRALLRGDELPASGIIRILTPSRFAFIVIRYSDNQITTRRCRNAGECNQPILLPRSIQVRSSIWDFIVSKAMKIIRQDPVSVSVNAGRSSDGTLLEAILELRSGGIDLAPVFSGMTEGDYYISIKRRPSNRKKPEEDKKPIKVSWRGGFAKATPAPIFQAGIYEIALLESGPDYKQTLTNAWVLVSDHDHYVRNIAQFSEAKSLIATWRTDVTENTATSFLRALLIYEESQSTR